MFINYKSYSDLSHDIKTNLHKIPKDVSLIVGIPRSGLLAANILSLYLNVPLTDLDGFTRGELLTSALRPDLTPEDAFKGRILIVDDSINSGHALKEAKQKLEQLLLSEKYILSFCCIYVSPRKKDIIDIPLVLLETPRVFEWNIFHHPVLGNSCMALDGVLCEDVGTAERAMDEAAYARLLQNARPKLLPKVKINTLITTRAEKYRQATEEWLKTNGIAFGELVMLNKSGNATGISPSDGYAAFIAGEFRKRKEDVLFIESTKERGKKIFELTGKNVYCTDTNEMLSRETYTELAKKKTGRFVRELKKIATQAIARFL